MYYTIYKITNKINNKFYIGKHQTEDLNDGYMGSGKLIKRAIKKYGFDNFVKEILHIFDNEADMNAKEKELVVLSEQSYNLCDGGHGGFGYINRNPNLFLTEKRLKSLMTNKERIQRFKHKLANDSIFREKHRQISLKALEVSRKMYPEGVFKGKRHTEETKNKMRKSKNVGSKNSQYGTCWMTNGQENKKIKKEDIDFWSSKGYYKGRVNAALV